jgi:hypothetical protein
MDHIKKKTYSNPVADEEALSTVSKQEGNLEWKQFIQKELEKLENQEKDEGKEDSEKTPSAFSSLIEQIPLEQLIDSTITAIQILTKLEKTYEEPNKPVYDKYENFIIRSKRRF